ncbi:MAG TPA: TfoX/Sxy family protein [Candidatus Sulfotelmatobacter sp.]|nr:TfoX/Sxy family protein [Candidatus Sulfotelmatobacter sp.]
MDFSPSPGDLVALFDRVAPTGPDVTRRKMFGWPAAFVNGNMCCSLHRDRVVLRLGDAERAELEALGGAPFEPMPGRPMKGYLTAPPSLLADEATLRTWLARTAEFARTLPPK